MSLLSRGILRIGIWRRRAHGKRDGFGWAVGGSAALHLLIALLIIFALPGLMAPPPAEEVVLPLNLVQLGGATIPSAPEKTVGQRAEAPPEAPQAEPPKPDRPVEIRPQKKPPSLDDVNTLVRLVEKLHQPAPAVPDAPPQSRTGPSTLTAANNNAELGRPGTFSVKDFLRAQIERYWEFDVRKLGAADVVVSIHMVIERDGRVTSADIVADPRYTSDPTYRELADSARRAVLIASPLQLPPGPRDAFRDMTLSFSPRDTGR